MLHAGNSALEADSLCSMLRTGSSEIVEESPLTTTSLAYLSSSGKINDLLFEFKLF